MTVSIKISVNGNYKVPFSFIQGGREERHVISGFGMDRPNEHFINFHHGPDAMTLVVGPEVQDNGEITISPAQLVGAFTRWHADLQKKPCPDDPVAQAEALLTYLRDPSAEG